MELLSLGIKRLGIIQEAAVVVRPLTFFVGPNNTNKSWTAYSLFGILRPKNIESALLEASNDRRYHVIRKLREKYQLFVDKGVLDCSFF